MEGAHVLSAIFFLFCTLIALFYLFRLVYGRRWLHHFNAEDDVGHGLMAIGMALMFMPVENVPSDLLRWNILVFAVASLWWLLRLFVRKPLLLPAQRCSPSAHSTFQSAGILVFMHCGMCYMFLLMSSMEISMTQPAIYVTGLFFVVFAYLACCYGRELVRDLRAAPKDWLHLGTRLAHTSMSSMMSWVFLSMLLMTARMKG